MPATGTEEKKRTFINMSMKKKRRGRKQNRKRCFKNNQAQKCLETEICC